MADTRPFDITPRALTIPTLMGLLAASLLVPRFSSSGASPVRQQGALPSAAQAAAPKNALTADDLLSDYFGVDRGGIKESLHQAVADAAALHKTGVHFLIATVPDPIDSYETWQFDPQVDAIRQGIEASGYLFDRFYLPGTGIDPKTDAEKAATLRDLHTHWPGVILFRWTNKTIPTPDMNEHSVLVTFLIPETPVAGIHQEPFRRALGFIYAWMHDYPTLASPDEGIRILGPTYSGSTQSLVRGLVSYDQALPAAVSRTTVSIVSGSASNDSNRVTLEKATSSRLHALSVSFRATMQSNAAVAKGLEDFLTSAGIDGLSASLSESSTAYGSDLADRAREKEKSAPQPTHLSIKFPFNVAQLRRDAGRDGSTKTDPPAGGVPSFRPLTLDDATVPTDQLPLQTPGTTSSSVELVLANMLDAIHREHVRIVRLDATDIRDKLFLIKELRTHAPDVLIVSTDTDLFQVHPDQAQWLRGLLLSSTYPLHTSSQTLVYPFHGPGAAARPNGELVQFASVNEQGYYNAAIALLNYHIHDGMPEARFKDKDRASLPKLVDYGGIGPGCLRGEPGVWISVVGDGEIVPLHVACKMDSVVAWNEEKPYPYVFVPNFNDSTAEPPSVHEVSASRLTTLLIVFVLAVSTVACGFALARASNVGAERLGAIGLGLCGVLVPLATLGIIFLAAANEFRQGDAFWPSPIAALAALACFGAAMYIVYFQLKSRTLRLVRLFFAGIAALSAAYVVLQLDAVPQIFLLRVLDVGTRMSPLLPIAAFGGVAIALACVELRRLQSFGIGGEPGNGEKASDARESWAAALDSIAGEATFGLTGIRDALVKSHDQLFFLPFGSQPLQHAWAIAPFVMALLAHVVMFRSLDHPILTVEGRLFAWTLVLIITFLNWVFLTALTQFLYLASSTAQLLLRLGRHPKSLPWDTVPKEHAAIGLVPKAPTLHDLTPLAAEIPDGLTTLQSDLNAQTPKRWFQSETWAEVNSEVKRLTGPDADQIGSADRAKRLRAMKVVIVVRELLSRLSFNVLTMGPLLVLLIVLYWTVYFDRSHALLGLIWFDVLIAMAAIMSVFVWIDRDAVVSGIRGTTPGAIDWNWAFVSKILLYVVLPLLTLFATQFPDIGSSLVRFLQPVQRLPGS